VETPTADEYDFIVHWLSGQLSTHRIETPSELVAQARELYPIVRSMQQG